MPVTIPEELLAEAKEDPWIGKRMRLHEGFSPIAFTNEEGEVTGFQLPGKSAKTGKTITGTVYVGKKHRGNGYAAQALRSFFEEHPDAVSYVNKLNKASISAHRKAGLSDTGIQVPGNRKASVWAKKKEAVMEKTSALMAYLGYLEKTAQQMPEEERYPGCRSGIGAGGLGRGNFRMKGLCVMNKVAMRLRGARLLEAMGKAYKNPADIALRQLKIDALRAASPAEREIARQMAGRSPLIPKTFAGFGSAAVPGGRVGVMPQLPTRGPASLWKRGSNMDKTALSRETLARTEEEYRQLQQRGVPGPLRRKASRRLLERLYPIATAKEKEKMGLRKLLAEKYPDLGPNYAGVDYSSRVGKALKEFRTPPPVAEKPLSWWARQSRLNRGLMLGGGGAGLAGIAIAARLLADREPNMHKTSSEIASSVRRKVAGLKPKKKSDIDANIEAARLLVARGKLPTLPKRLSELLPDKYAATGMLSSTSSTSSSKSKGMLGTQFRVEKPLPKINPSAAAAGQMPTQNVEQGTAEGAAKGIDVTASLLADRVLRRIR